MCRATWTESGCESQVGPMELRPEPVLIRPAHSVGPVRPLKRHVGPRWTSPRPLIPLIPLSPPTLDGTASANTTTGHPKGWPAREVSAGSHWPPGSQHVIPVTTHLLPLPRLVDRIASVFRFFIAFDSLPALYFCYIRQTSSAWTVSRRLATPLICPVCGYRRSAPSPPSPARPSRVIIHPSLQRQRGS